MAATVVATKRKKGAGSELHIDLTQGGTFVLIEGCETLPQLGGNAEYTDETRIHETVRSYTENMETPQEVEYVFDDLPDDTDQQALIDAAIARDTIDAQHLYSNGRIGTFTLELMDHYQGEAGVEENLMHGIKGRIRSIAWSKVV